MNELKTLILDKLSQGLPICEEPYQFLAGELGLDEDSLLQLITQLRNENYIKRLGLVMNHRHLGYDANAMVVWRIPEEKIKKIGKQLAKEKLVTLCYQRQPCAPCWPYNLYAMIHGTSQESVRSSLDEIIMQHSLQKYQKQILFSTRQFKQTGARHYA